MASCCLLSSMAPSWGSCRFNDWGSREWCCSARLCLHLSLINFSWARKKRNHNFKKSSSAFPDLSWSYIVSFSFLLFLLLVFFLVFSFASIKQNCKFCILVLKLVLYLELWYLVKNCKYVIIRAERFLMFGHVSSLRNVICIEGKAGLPKLAFFRYMDNLLST